MADGDAKPGDKKDGKKEEQSFLAELFEIFGIGEWIIIGIILFAIGIRLQTFFAGSGGEASHFSQWLLASPNIQANIDSARVWISETLSSLAAFSTGFSVLLAAVIGYIIFRQSEVNKAWHKVLYQAPAASPTISPTPTFVGPIAGAPNNLPTNLPSGAPVFFTVRSEVNPRWQQVMAHISSDNPSDWRLAILEADIILQETLDRAGYVGDTLGDKLKNAERRPFASLNAAWEAHKIRNTIAHEGQSFEVTQRESKRVISLFEGVFREFGVI